MPQKPAKKEHEWDWDKAKQTIEKLTKAREEQDRLAKEIDKNLRQMEFDALSRKLDKMELHNKALASEMDRGYDKITKDADTILALLSEQNANLERRLRKIERERAGAQGSGSQSYPAARVENIRGEMLRLIFDLILADPSIFPPEVFSVKTDSFQTEAGRAEVLKAIDDFVGKLQPIAGFVEWIKSVISKL